LIGVTYLAGQLPVTVFRKTYVPMNKAATTRLHLKRDGTRAENRFRLSAKRTIPFKTAGASFQSSNGSGGVRISGSNVGYTMFRGSVKSTGYSLHSPLSPSLPLSCVIACHHISTGLYALSTKVFCFLHLCRFLWCESQLSLGRNDQAKG
jgi:hypothetical protein